MEQASLISALCLLLVQPQLSLYSDTLQYLEDCAALCIDDMTTAMGITSSGMSVMAPGSLGSQATTTDVSEHQRILASLKAEIQKSASDDSVVSFLFSSPKEREHSWLGLVVPLQPHGQSQKPQSQPSHGFGHQRSNSGAFGGAASMQRIPSQLQRSQSVATPGGGMSTPVGGNKTFAPPIPFLVQNWDLLPDQGSAGAINDTAISLSLFGTRKV
jgi:hypothetical protein